MIETLKNRIFKNIHQVGIVTQDVRKTLKKFIKLYGIGPWDLWEFGPEMVEDMHVMGKKTDYRMLIATCKQMNVDFELIEPLDDKSIYSDFLSKHGEGIQHLNYDAYDYDSLMEIFKNKKIPIAQFGNLVGKHRYVYFDTLGDAGHTIETSGNLPGFKRREPLETFPIEDAMAIENNPGFKRISQIGIVVSDLISTVQALNDKYTIGPWRFYKFDLGISYPLRVAVSIFDDVELILLQTEYRDSIFSSFMDKAGQGLFYLAFEVDDYVKSLESASGRSIQKLQTLDLSSRRYTFLNTYKDLKFISCIYDKGPGFEKLEPYDLYPKKEI